MLPYLCGAAIPYSREGDARAAVIKDSCDGNQAVIWVAHYRAMNFKQKRLTEEARCISTALVVGLALYGAALGLEKTPVGQELQKSAYTNTSKALSDKKTCMMLAWQQQSGGLDRAGCDHYLEQWDARGQALARNH